MDVVGDVSAPTSWAMYWLVDGLKVGASTVGVVGLRVPVGDLLGLCVGVPVVGSLVGAGVGCVGDVVGRTVGLGVGSVLRHNKTVTVGIGTVSLVTVPVPTLRGLGDRETHRPPLEKELLPSLNDMVASVQAPWEWDNPVLPGFEA
ncbi:hypothetical protein BASA81_001000, partial [Batrachochytrium salamandrivorans]